MKNRTLIFISIFLALLGIIFLTENRQEELPQSVATDPPLRFLFAEKSSLVTGLTIITEEATLVLKRGDNGLWVAIQPSGAMFEQGTVEAALSQLRALPFLAEDLPLTASDVGIREQAPLVSVSFAADGESAFRVGDPTPSGSGYYIQYGEQIGILERDSLDTFLNLLKYFSFS